MDAATSEAVQAVRPLIDLLKRKVSATYPATIPTTRTTDTDIISEINRLRQHPNYHTLGSTVDGTLADIEDTVTILLSGYDSARNSRLLLKITLGLLRYEMAVLKGGWGNGD